MARKRMKWSRHKTKIYKKTEKDLAIRDGELFLKELESGIAFRRVYRHSLKRQDLDLMYHARIMKKYIEEIDCKKAVELGTGHGQGAVLLSHSVNLDDGGVFTCDIREKNMQTCTGLAEKYKSCVPLKYYVADSCQSEFVEDVMRDGKKIDALFIDSLHTRAQVTKEIKTWFPHLSDSCVVFFHDVIWCHDTVKVLVDDMLEGFKVYKFSKNMSKNSKIESWNGGIRMGIENGRPINQSIDEISDAHDWAKDRLILREDYFENNSSLDHLKYDFIYELLCSHPGMIILKKTNRIKWTDILKRYAF